jgi:hypothetical protein
MSPVTRAKLADALDVLAVCRWLATFDAGREPATTGEAHVAVAHELLTPDEAVARAVGRSWLMGRKAERDLAGLAPADARELFRRANDRLPADRRWKLAHRVDTPFAADVYVRD